MQLCWDGCGWRCSAVDVGVRAIVFGRLSHGGIHLTNDLDLHEDIQLAVRLFEAPFPAVDVLTEFGQRISILMQAIGQTLTLQVCQDAGDGGIDSAERGDGTVGAAGCAQNRQ